MSQYVRFKNNFKNFWFGVLLAFCLVVGGLYDYCGLV